MNRLRSLRVELVERSYSIHIGEGILCDLEPYLVELFPHCQHAVIIYDSGVASIASTASQMLERRDRRISRYCVPSGESSKSVIQLQELWENLLASATDRGSVIIAIGGGVIGDLAGFAAATYARGLPLIQIPTTLLSQVDSSVGGKTGINLPKAKNMVGAFWQPSLVVIDISTLQSLPKREYLSGLAEVVKYGVILLPELLDYLEKHSAEVLERQPEPLIHLISESCRAKASVVQDDERELSGRRAILNYGHTFAHAIEATEGYGRWLHGEAVAIGMHMAAHLALTMKRVDANFVDRQAALLRRLELPTCMPGMNPQILWEAMQSDKKSQHGALRFVLPQGPFGHVELVAGVTAAQAIRAMELSATAGV
jgi:3-dehydroquinate synthase